MTARGALPMLMSFVILAAAAGRAGAAKTPAAKAKPGAPRAVLLPTPGSPLCAVRILFRTGSVDDPPGKEGLAMMCAAMTGRGGTKTRSYAEVLDALYPLAASIDVHGDTETTVFSGTVHRDNLAAYLDLLAQQIGTPRFAEDDFTRNKQDALDDITKTLRGNDDENLGKAALASVMWKGHPYGRPTLGTVAGLRSITLDDVRSFCAARYTRDRMIAGLAGGFSPEVGAAFLSRFDSLPAKGVPVPKTPAPLARRAAELLLVEKDCRANAISLGFPIAVTRADADFYPLFVAASYLGEHRTFNGVLMNRMRQARGLNYGDYAYVESFIQDGWSTFPRPNIARNRQPFEIWLRPVVPANTGFALRQAIYETSRLLEDGIPQSGFDATREFLLGYSSLWTQDLSRRLGYAIDAAIYGKDIQKELRDRLPAMKKADVDRALRKHLLGKPWTAAIVTDKAGDLRDKLGSGAPTPIVYDTAGTPKDILDEDKVIEGYPLPFGKDAITVKPVAEMFER